jgi:dihydrodipicolinate synthase/N-acetylneuraminate lyase
LHTLVGHIAPHVDGVLLFGSNGEAVHLSPQERHAALNQARPPCRFWVGCGDETVAQAHAHMRAARDAGATGALVTPPRYYAGALGDEGLLRYFAALADAHTLPVWLYHIPQLTKTDMPVGVVEQLAAHANVVGIKDSSGQLARLAYYASRRLELTVCTGQASTLLGALALGVDGAVLATANLAPAAYRAMMHAWYAGDVQGARRWQNRLEPLGRVLGLGGFVLLKQAMRHLGLPAGYPRPPYPQRSPLWETFLPILEELRREGLLVTA